MARAPMAIFAAITLVLVSAPPLAAGPYEDGVAAYGKEYYVSAMSFWRPLADAGHAEAQANIGVLYREGQGVPQNNIAAYMWFSLSAARGNKKAGAERDIIARSMTAAQIAEAQRRAREWAPKQ